MSVIQRIRDKAAWLIFGAIALAMIGFIVTDAFQGGGRGLFSGPSTTYGKVNGKKIEYEKFSERVKMIEDQYPNQQNDYMRQRTYETVWNQMVDEVVLGKVYNKLGITVTDKEINDILFGKNPPEQLRQQFTDPNTGQYNAAQADQAIREFKKRNPQQYQNFITSLIQNRQREKYLSMLSNTSHVPKWMVEKLGADNSLVASISYVQIPYATIADSTVKVSDDDINEFLKEHSEEYKQEKSRSIAYVAFSASPSAADSAAVREKLKNLSAEFASTTDLKPFLLRSSSELPYYEGFISKGVIQVPNKDSILAVPVGGL
jgi:peptidyl-prolyl cis-trans isomerase D